MNYGNLLVQRSTDFAPFGQLLFGSYPDRSLIPVILDLMQQLWDRGDPDGYAQQMTTHPLPDTPSHTVLMQIAYGDHQVSMYSAAVEARTIGASAHEPALDLSTNRAPRPQPVLRDPDDRPLPVRRVGDRDLGQRARAACSRRRSANLAPVDSRDEQRPARRRPRHQGRAHAEVRLPGAERQRGRRLRRQAVPHGRLHALSSSAAALVAAAFLLAAAPAAQP